MCVIVCMIMERKCIGFEMISFINIKIYKNSRQKTSKTLNSASPGSCRQRASKTLNPKLSQPWLLQAKSKRNPKP